MAKLILMAVLPATIIIPMLASREPNPKKGMKKTVVQMLVFNAIWILLVLVVYPRLG